ncbi:hypothetical protein [Marisediminicola sp. LYQ134]|uniref:hypothetical protein n=1 Tax=Marisediminicola sp. LYQ134 TaxID=3391061 RepID=UPI003983264A
MIGLAAFCAVGCVLSLRAGSGTAPLWVLLLCLTAVVGFGLRKRDTSESPRTKTAAILATILIVVGSVTLVIVDDMHVIDNIR